MRPDLNRRIERHLDRQLGFWTRLFSWRSELATHLEDACLAKTEQNPTEDADPAWDKALAEFGDVRVIASGLQEEHAPNHMKLQLLTVAACLATVCFFVDWKSLLDFHSLAFVLVPAAAFAAYDLRRGSIRWEAVARVGSYATLAGAVIGLLGVGYYHGVLNVFSLAQFDASSSASKLGAFLAIGLISTFYGVLFFSPSKRLVVGLLSLALTEITVMLHWLATACGEPASNLFFPKAAVDPTDGLRIAMLSAAVFAAGLARFGRHGLAQRAFAVGAGAFLLNAINRLGNLDPDRFAGQMAVSLVAMGLVVVVSLSAGDWATQQRRELSS